MTRRLARSVTVFVLVTLFAVFGVITAFHSADSAPFPRRDPRQVAPPPPICTDATAGNDLMTGTNGHPALTRDSSEHISFGDAGVLFGDLISRLDACAHSSDIDGVLHTLVEMGRRLRSDSTPQSTDVVARAIRASTDPQLRALLAYVLAGYSTVPSGLFAELIASATLPSELVPAVAVGETIAQIPTDWDRDKQELFWRQFLLTYPDVLPVIRAEYVDATPLPPGTYARGVPNELVQQTQRTMVDDVESVRAVFSRALSDEQVGWRILRRVFGYFDLSSDGAASEVARALARASHPELRKELLEWLSLVPLEKAQRELHRVYDATEDPRERLIAGTTLILQDRASGPAVFRVLWDKEVNEDVRMALVRAVGSLRLDSGLRELQYAFDSGSDKVKESVREQVYVQLMDGAGADQSTARSMIERIGKPSNAARNRVQTPVSEKDGGR